MKAPKTYNPYFMAVVATFGGALWVFKLPTMPSLMMGC